MKRSKQARSVPGEAVAVVQSPFTKKIDLPLALRLRIKDGLTTEQIAERFDCSPQAVRLAFSRFICLTDNPEELEAYRAHKAGLFETLEQALIERLLKETISGRASIGDLARGLDVVSKHVRLLAGQSTQNIGLLVQTLGDVHKDVIGAVQVIDNTKESEQAGDGTPLAIASPMPV